jgi:hypothetical protein
MRRWLAAVVVFGCVLFGVRVADASVQISVDKSSQTMTVTVDGDVRHVWAVSTGRAGYRTPVGSWRPTRMHREWYSRRYDMAPMPHSIFFTGGYAIHGTYETGKLGRPASRGCVRLSPANARTLFNLVQAEGAGNTRISIRGSSPEPTYAAKRKPRGSEVAQKRGSNRVAATAKPRGNDRDGVRGWSRDTRTLPASALGFNSRPRTGVYSPDFWMLRR